jgi:hypothetical protein
LYVEPCCRLINNEKDAFMNNIQRLLLAAAFTATSGVALAEEGGTPSGQEIRQEQMPAQASGVEQPPGQVQNQQPSGQNAGRAELREDRQEIREDRGELRGDRRDRRQSRRDLRQEVREGDKAGAAEARGDLREDRREIRGDRRELRGDHRELRQDRRGARRERAGS